MLAASFTAIYFCFKFIFGKQNSTVSFNKWIFIFLLLWLVSISFSAIFSINPQISFWGSQERFQGLLTHFIYIFYFIIFYKFLAQKNHQELFLKALIFFGVITSLIAIAQQFGFATLNDPKLTITIGRSFGTLGHPNMLGQFLLSPIIAAMYFFKNHKKIYSLSLLILIIALLTTGNRASFLALGLSVVFLFFYLWNTTPFKKILTFLSISLLTAFFIFTFGHSLNSIFTRFSIWQTSVPLLQENPFLGHGLETFKLVFQKVSTPELLISENFYSIADRSHNEYLDILLNQGLLGLTVWLLILILTFISSLKKKNPDLQIFLNAMLLADAITVFFSFHLTVHYLLLAAVLAMILNNTLSKSTFSFKKNLPLAFIAGALLTLSILLTLTALRIAYADILYARGLKYVLKNDYANANIELLYSLKINPHQPTTIFLLSETLSATGRADEAQNLLTVLGKNYIDDARYYLSQSTSHTALEEYDKAIAALNHALKIAPSQPLILENLIEAEHNAKYYEKCAATFQKYLNLIPPYWQWKEKIETHSYEDREKYRLFFKDKPYFWTIFEKGKTCEKLRAK